MVNSTINGFHFQIALEPDGKGSHWFRVSKTMLKGTGAEANDTVTIELESTKEWPEPEVPSDFESVLTAIPEMNQIWMNITPMARWDWIRWIRAPRQPQTRKRRIETACDMLRSGKRRPCCFNRNQCTEPYVSRNGVLLEPPRTTKIDKTAKRDRA